MSEVATHSKIPVNHNFSHCLGSAESENIFQRSGGYCDITDPDDSSIMQHPHDRFHPTSCDVALVVPCNWVVKSCTTDFK